jgi:hypothetical protein
MIRVLPYDWEARVLPYYWEARVLPYDWELGFSRMTSDEI